MSIDKRVKTVETIRTAPLFDIVVDLNAPVDFGGDGPLGRRVLYGAAGGSFHGPRLRGEVVAGGGDWALFRTNPLFETGSTRYAWLNDVVALGTGYLVDGGVAYHVEQVL